MYRKASTSSGPTPSALGVCDLVQLPSVGPGTCTGPVALRSQGELIKIQIWGLCL